MTEYTVYVIGAELLVWMVVFTKMMNHGIYRSMLLSDFVVTTIDFVLLFTPLRSTLLTITLYNRRTGQPILSIPVTFGMILLMKSIVFYLMQEVFPELPKQLNTLLRSEEEVREDEQERGLSTNKYR